MAVALRFGIVILPSDWSGDAAYVHSDLNGFGDMAEARMLYIVPSLCGTAVRR